MRTALFITLTLFLGSQAHADNVDLVTLPARDHVQLTIYNSEDITLVKETRSLTFKKGSNRIQFSWANTLIDPSSVEFRVLDHADEIELVDTVFPGQKPQFLYWNIQSEYQGQARVEVSYFTSGMTWSMDYVATADPEEAHMDFDGYVRVYNKSGEAYENAEVRLIVGTINLVEKIAELARRRGIPVPAPATLNARLLRFESAKGAMDMAQSAAKERDAERKIVKQGLSEYFMFTVDGTETVKHGWSKRMRAVKSQNAKFDVLYRMRAHQYGPRPVRFFVWKNDEEHGLGDSPLPNGTVRVFRRNGKDGLSYLGEQLVRYVPVRAPIEVNLGADDLVVYETKRVGVERFNFTFNKHNRVHGWDERSQWVDEIRNYRGKPIRFELRRIWQGDVELSTEPAVKLFDYRTMDVAFDVPARGRSSLSATALVHHGKNAKQNRLKLK